MVIEYFKNGDPKPIGDRFRVHGRMLPENVVYHIADTVHLPGPMELPFVLHRRPSELLDSA